MTLEVRSIKASVRGLRSLTPVVRNARCLCAAPVRPLGNDYRPRYVQTPIDRRQCRTISTTRRLQLFSGVQGTTRADTYEHPTSYSKDVNVPWRGRTVNMSAMWLRDACVCKDCVDPSSKQKNFATLDIPTNIAGKVTQQSAESVAIEWTNDVPGSPAGHLTTLNTALLQRMLAATGPDNSRHQCVQWDALQFKDQCKDISYSEYMQDDRALLEAIIQLETHGLLFLKDVPDDESAVNGIVERIGPLKNTFYGLTWDVRSVPQAKNVAYTSGDLDFHMDLMYVQDPPALQFLHCIRSSAKGGASRFTDLYSAMTSLLEQSPEAVADLGAIRITYEYQHETEKYRRMRPVIDLPDSVLESNSLHPGVVSNTMRDGTLYSWSPPFQGLFGAGRGASPYETASSFEKWHAAASKLRSIFEEQDRVVERLMRSGDCVIFDNRRVLHARTAFEVGDAGVERFLKGAYLDRDVWSSRSRTLKARFASVQPEEASFTSL